MLKDVFRDICSNIEVSCENVNEIRECAKNIVKCVDDEFESSLAVKNSQFIGSYGRNTAVYTNNIRLMCIIPEVMYWQVSISINGILEKMKRGIQKKYITCEYSDNGNGLNILVNSNLSFEIVPGFMYDNGEYIYLLNKNWQNLHLKLERKNFKQVNKKVNNNLVELCRILKIWKNLKSLDISNILLDSLAYNFFNSNDSEKKYTFDTYDEMLLDFFTYLLPRSKKENFVSFDGETILKRRIDLYEETYRSMEIAQTALASADCGMTDEAIKDWKRVLGYNFIK